MNQNRAYLTPNIRGKKQISDVYTITFNATSDNSTKTFSTLSQSMDFSLLYDDSFITMAQESQISLYKYNSSINAYEPYTAVLEADKNRVTARIQEAGHYVLLTNY